jgi:VanZ family protein
MTRKQLGLLVLSLVFFIFFANLAAMKFFWYYSIGWFDMFMHFLGGFWLGCLLLWLFRVEQMSLQSSFFILGGVLVVGVLWEIFEVFFHQYIAGSPFDLRDTLSDLFFDFAGGLLSLLVFSGKIMPNRGGAV